MTRLSIVIPTRNRVDLLRECLRHTARAFPEAEIVVIDNASTDGTVKMANDFPGVTVLANERDVGPHLNYVIAHRSASEDARYVLRLADDDFLDPDAVEAALRKLEAAPRLVALFAPWRMQDALGGNLGLFYRQDTPVEVTGAAQALFLSVAHSVMPECAIFRGDFARQMLPPQPHIALPFLHLAQALKAGPVLFDSDPFYVMRLGVSEQAGIRDCATAWDDMRGGLELLASMAREVPLMDRCFLIDGYVAGRMVAAERVNRMLGNVDAADALEARLAMYMEGEGK